jgi:uncharacterized damage-inducible protein DinB
MGESAASARAVAIAARLHEASARLIALLEQVDDPLWRAVPGTGVWSIGREAEHVGEAAVYHQWLVRLSIGEKVASRRPVLERSQMTPHGSPSEVLDLIRRRTAESARLIGDLSDEQLDLPTRPPRAMAQRLAATIERVLVGHYDAHRAGIEAKVISAAPRARLR